MGSWAVRDIWKLHTCDHMRTDQQSKGCLTFVVVQLLRTGLHHFSVHCHPRVLQSKMVKHFQIHLTCRCIKKTTHMIRGTLWIMGHLNTSEHSNSYLLVLIISLYELLINVLVGRALENTRLRDLGLGLMLQFR